MKTKEILDWMIQKEDFEFEEFKEKFRLDEDITKEILDKLKENEIVLNSGKEPYSEYILTEKFQTFQNKLQSEAKSDLKPILEDIETKVKPDVATLNDWSDVQEIEKFVIFDGSERIYEIHIDDKIIKLEGKDIMDYNEFRLRFFEKFGRLLETYKGIKSDWSNLVSYWYRKYGEVKKQKTENLSEQQEAVELVIDYINNCSIASKHVVKEGLVSIRNDRIYVPTRIIKKILKRENLRVSMRKLAYLLDDYLAAASIPMTINNKSERFWRFRKNSFDLDEEDKIEIQEEEDE